MNPAPHSHPAFKISHPEKPDVAPQTAWTQAQAETKQARLAAEHGEGFVIEPIPYAAPGDNPPPPEPEPAPVEGAPRKIIGRDDPCRCPEQPFVPGDVLQCQHSGTQVEVVAVNQTSTDVRVLENGSTYPIPATHYGDYTLEKEGEVPPPVPEPAPTEPEVPANPAPDPESKKKLAPRRPPLKKQAKAAPRKPRR